MKKNPKIELLASLGGLGLVFLAIFGIVSFVFAFPVFAIALILFCVFFMSGK